MNDSLKDIFDKFYTPLCNYANAILSDKHTAEDVVQSIFIQLWEKNKIQRLENPEPYLLRCVKYKCIDHQRGAKQKYEQSFDELPDIVQSEYTELAEEDILPVLHFFAAKLPPKMQKVFLLSRTKGLSYKQIAEHEDISVKTVENQMGSALKKLRQLLLDHHYLSIFLSQIFF